MRGFHRVFLTGVILSLSGCGKVSGPSADLLPEVLTDAGGDGVETDRGWDGADDVLPPDEIPREELTSEEGLSGDAGPQEVWGDGPSAGDAVEEPESPAPDVQTPPPCVPGTWPEGVFAPFGTIGTPMIQIHPNVVHDGEAVWWALNLPATDGSSNLEPWGARMGCDGRFLVDPFPLAQQGKNAVDPTLALREGTLLFAWQVDDPEQFPANMSIWTRAFGIDGTPRTEAPVRLAPRRNGRELVATLWMPFLSATREGFLLAATLADPDRGRFQAYLASLDEEGQPVLAPDGTEPRDGWMPAPDDAADQTGTTVTRWMNQLVVAWVRSTETDPDRVHLTVAGRPGGPLLIPPTPVPEGEMESSAPVLASEPSGSLMVLALTVGSTDSSVRLLQPQFGEAGFSERVLDQAGRPDLGPAIALGDGVGAVAWFRIRSGYQADARFQAFSMGSEGLRLLGEEVLLNPSEVEEPHDAIAAYPLAITAVGSRSFLVAWVERRRVPGGNPQYQVMARFLSLVEAAGQGVTVR